MSVTCKAARMQAAVIFAIALAGPQLIVATMSPANAAAAGCNQTVQKLQNQVAKIAMTKDEYFGHQKNYVDLLFGRSRFIVRDSKKRAEAEKSQAGPRKVAMPQLLSNFQSLLATARSQNCLNANDLRMIEESTTDWARLVNFAQFPEDEGTE